MNTLHWPHATEIPSNTLRTHLAVRNQTFRGRPALEIAMRVRRTEEELLGQRS